MSKVKLSLDELNISEKSQLAINIVTAMTGNATYPTPNPALAAVQTLANALTTAAAQAEEKRRESQIATIAQDEAEVALAAALTRLGSYVENTSGGDEALILSAGMAVRETGTSAGTPAAPGPVAATTGDQPGEVDLTWPRLGAAKSFVIQYATAADAADADWKFAITSTKSSCSVTGLGSGTRYWFRVAATGSAGQGPWSSPATARTI
jgi:hypothetical protein